MYIPLLQCTMKLSIFYTMYFCVIFLKSANTLELYKYENCSNAEYPLNVYPGKVMKNGNQFITADFKMDIDFGSNTKVDIVVFTEKNKKWRQLIKTSHSKGACDFYNKFGGEMWWDMEKAFKLTPKICPMVAGSYEMKDYEMKLNKMNLPKLPKGKIKLDLKIIEKKTGKIVMCPIFFIKT